MTWTTITLLALSLGAATWVSCHALLNKRDPRAATGWIALAFLSPLIGSVLYYLFGINRVQTRARRMARGSFSTTANPNATACSASTLPEQVETLAAIAGRVTGRPLLGGNEIRCLHNGEQTYPEMLQAIDQARHSLYLTTYIFDTCHIGQRFIEALEKAQKRGVDVRVIIDGVGEMTNRPRASSLLLKQGVRVGRFIPPRLIPPSVSINLRNHRKILVVDGNIAFTGGMNISHKHLADNSNADRVTDVHFCLRGPIASEIQQAFLEDWSFTTDEQATDSTATIAPQGNAHCRVIIDGPNEYLDQLTKVLVAVTSAARHRVAVMTPYFLPPRSLLAALRAAALRGVDVMVILPAQSDHAFVTWATNNLLPLLFEDGIRVYYQPPPFAHSKLFLIDKHYALIGSANMDPRSLRLNFELGVEIYDEAINTHLWQHCQTIEQGSRRLTETEFEQRSLPIRLRDAFAWLWSPYL